MSIQSGLYSYLGGVTAVTDLVSTRIYPAQAPNTAALPYVVHNVISTRRMPHLLGSSGMVRSRVQIDVYAVSLDAAQSVSVALRDNLDGFRNSTMGSEDVLSVNLDDERTDLIAPSDGGDVGTHRVTQDYIFLYGESLPST